MMWIAENLRSIGYHIHIYVYILDSIHFSRCIHCEVILISISGRFSAQDFGYKSKLNLWIISRWLGTFNRKTHHERHKQSLGFALERRDSLFVIPGAATLANPPTHTLTPAPLPEVISWTIYLSCISHRWVQFIINTILYVHICDTYKHIHRRRVHPRGTHFHSLNAT